MKRQLLVIFHALLSFFLSLCIPLPLTVSYLLYFVCFRGKHLLCTNIAVVAEDDLFWFLFPLSIFCFSLNSLLREQRIGQHQQTNVSLYIKMLSHCSLFDAQYFLVVPLCLLNARTLSCCTGVCTSSLGLMVALICFSFSLLGCLPLQDHQTLQHKSDWQCITAAIFLSHRDTKCKLLTGT